MVMWKFFSISKSRRVNETTTPELPESPEPRSERSQSLETDATITGSRDEYTTGSQSSYFNYEHRRSEPSVPASLSNIPIRTRSGPASRADDPLDLTLVHNPNLPHAIDIIFIHGLGGSSRLSWCKNHDMDLFWPMRWLPKDQDLQNARVFTFGYNADFRSSSQSPTLGIADFAKNLLYDMVYATDRQGANLGIGETPVAFVVHSMGGLVFKKMYLEAQLDDRYAKIAEAIKAVVFLATPHRGADLSETLNKLLSVSFRNSPKQYVSELGKHGAFLRTVNDQFRHTAKHLQIFSFYETLQTSLGIGSTLVVTEDASKLGYPGEVSRSLNANHHDVCKFATPDDANYRAVMGAIKAIVNSFAESHVESMEEDLEKVRALLAVPDLQDHDLGVFASRQLDGTCVSTLQDHRLASWLSTEPSSKLLWLQSKPARGKSVFCSFLVNHLRETSNTVQHFFFRDGDETKRSVGSLLRSLAFQLASQIPEYRQALISLANSGYRPKDTDWKAMWKQLFAPILTQSMATLPIYWIIDGLDETPAAQQVFDLIGDVRNSTTPIRVLLASRWTPLLATSFARVSSRLNSLSFSLDNNTTDMRRFVEEELQYLGWDSSVKAEVMAKVLDQANDNFLWVRLIMEEIRECNTEEDVRFAFKIRRPSDKNLARQLLMWTIHTRRPIAMDELMEILTPEFGQILDLATSASRLCGHFIVIEGQNRLGILHKTAREYLTATAQLPFSLEEVTCHNEIFELCVTSFMEKGLRSRLRNAETPPLVYRATSWMHHLMKAARASSRSSVIDSDRQLDILTRFFTQSSVLSWIQSLASFRQLRTLVEVSHALSSFVKRKRKEDSARDPSMRRFEDLEMLEVWARDLLKLPGKFGRILLQDPSAIQTSVAPFCPIGSAIHKLFSTASPKPKVRGLPEDWDDCLARFSIGKDRQGASIKTCSQYLAVADTEGSISIWDSTTFHHLKQLEHGAAVSAMSFSSSGRQIATYGLRNTKVWDIGNGDILKSINNPPDMRALTLVFTDNDSSLLVGTERRCVLKVPITVDSAPSAWKEAISLSDVESVEGTYLNAPTVMSVSPDHTKIIAAYRRFPAAVWDLSTARAMRRINRDCKSGRSASLLPFVQGISWHPNSEEFVGIFLDGYTFQMNLIENTYREQAPEGQFPAAIRMSPDGLMYAICGVSGTTRLYDYQTSVLIYQLNSEALVTDLCFSQDGRRLYDLRSNSCNVWEPNALVRLEAAEDNPASSQAPEESIEQSNFASESFADNPVPIVVVALIPSHSVVCFGDDDGLLVLLDYATGERVLLDQTVSGMAIEHLSCNNDNHLVYAEVSSRLTVLRLQSAAAGWSNERVARFKPQSNAGEIKQLLLSPDSKLLLVSTERTVQMWSLYPKAQIHVMDTTQLWQPSSWWALHSTSANHLLSITALQCRIVGLDDAAIARQFRVAQGQPMTPYAIEAGGTTQQSHKPSLVMGEPDEYLERVQPTHYKGHLLLTLTRRNTRGNSQSRFAVLDSGTNLSEPSNDESVLPYWIPPEISNQIEVALNVLKNGHIIYLDQSFGVCTWSLKSVRGLEDVKRHFFVPRDWIMQDSLHLLAVDVDGTILCPRNGSVSAIETSTVSEW
ncbi:NACHT and WD domain protein [Apiospora arundinis]